MKVLAHLRKAASFYMVLFFPFILQLHLEVLTENNRVLYALCFPFLNFFFLNACKNYSIRTRIGYAVKCTKLITGRSERLYSPKILKQCLLVLLVTVAEIKVEKGAGRGLL